MMEQQVLSFQDIPDDVLKQALDLGQQSYAVIAPYLLALTSDDRKVMLKMSDGTEPFVQKGQEYIGNNPSLVPNYVDKALLAKACHTYSGLTPLLSFFTAYTSQISDTRMVAGGNSFHQTLSFYTFVRTAATRRVQGAKAIYEDMKKRFNRKKKKDENTVTAKAAEQNMETVA